MDKNKLWKWMLLGILVIWSLTLVTPLDQKVKLGLDLRGGSSFVVEVDAEDVAKKMVESQRDDDGNALYGSVDDISDSDLKKQIKVVQEIAVEVIRNRIDVLGTAEPEIYPQGDARIVVRLPGADAGTRSEARRMLQADAVLSFKLVHLESDAWVNELLSQGTVPPGFKVGAQDGAGAYLLRDRAALADEELTREFYTSLKSFGGKTADFMLEEDKLKDGSTIFRPRYIMRRIELSGDSIKDARVSYDPLSGAPNISLEFNREGAEEFARVTEANVNRKLAIILDDKLTQAPNINEAIRSGRAEISGSFSMQEARESVNVLKAGALPGRVKIVEERTVAPTLGKDSISSGVQAIAIGGIAVLVFMAAYYLVPGMIANLSLLFVLIMLPAGMVLAAGLLGAATGSLEGGAVGLPVLTLYGIAGIVLTVGMAVDANVLTFERMREEWKVGKSISGSINAGYNKAFSTILDANITTLLTAVILFWQGSGPIRGFAVTLSAGILVSMFIVLVITRLFFNTMADTGMLKSIKMMSIPFLQNPHFNFVGGRKIAAVVSLALILGSWGYFFSKGQANFGVDFTGGTVTTFEFQQEHPIDSIRSAVADAGFPNASIAQMEENGKHFVDVKLKAMEGGEKAAQDAVLALDGAPTIVKTDSVGSQIGAELKKKGINAIIFALIGIIIYISIRFEFAFAAGAITALAHDVLITVGIYCALGNQLSMPIIAALLTIVGYSVNDTIVVFDRIREDLKFETGKSYMEVANLSINQTLSRTVLTSVTTLLTVVTLLVVGGGAVHDFALALFIGILVGTYSSIFVATPVVLLWHKEEKVK